MAGKDGADGSTDGASPPGQTRRDLRLAAQLRANLARRKAQARARAAADPAQVDGMPADPAESDPALDPGKPAT